MGITVRWSRVMAALMPHCPRCRRALETEHGKLRIDIAFY